MIQSFSQQTARLSQAGYPGELVVSVAEKLLRNVKASASNMPPASQERDKRKCVVIPYIHKVSYNIKKIAQKADVKVLFSAPAKLASVCKMTDPNCKEKKSCKKKHQARYVNCIEGVVYRIPLTCSRVYIGQTGRCINERLHEHAYNVKNKKGGWVAIYCEKCGCKPDYQT